MPYSYSIIEVMLCFFFFSRGSKLGLTCLSQLKHVLKQDAGLELNVSKTSVLPKDTTQEDVFDVAHNINNTNPTLTHLISICLSSVVLMFLYRTLYLKHVDYCTYYYR